MSKLLTTNDLAERLQVNPDLVIRSRVSGLLLGSPAPKHLKMGRTIRYEVEAIEEFINSFKESNQ